MCLLWIPFSAYRVVGCKIEVKQGLHHQRFYVILTRVNTLFSVNVLALIFNFTVPMKDIDLFIAIAVSVMYIGLSTMNASLIGHKYYLILLANKRHYLVNLLLTLLLGGWGVWRAKHGSVHEIFYLAPCCFLILLRLLNWCTLLLYGRYILLVSKYDTTPEDPEFKARFFDRLGFLVLLVVPLLVPAFLLKSIC